MPQREKHLCKNPEGRQKYFEEVKSVQYGYSHHLTFNTGIREAYSKQLEGKSQVLGSGDEKQFQ